MTHLAMTRLFLAQDSTPAPAPGPKPTTGSILLWVGLLLAAALAGGFLWMWMRRQLFAPDAGSSAGTIMEDLRRMRNEGQITQEEYDSIRKNMAARLAKGGFGAEKPPARPTPGRDGR